MNIIIICVNEISTNGPILYLFAYIPRTRRWYRLKKIHRDGGSFALLIVPDWYESCRFDALHDDLLFINDGVEEVIVNAVNSFQTNQICFRRNQWDRNRSIAS